jgi:glutaredoxin-related protein
MMIKIYGMHTCPYCDHLHPQIEGKKDQYQYIDIGQHIRNMHEFMDLRDNRPEFTLMLSPVLYPFLSCYECSQGQN